MSATNSISLFNTGNLATSRDESTIHSLKLSNQHGNTWEYMGYKGYKWYVSTTANGWHKAMPHWHPKNKLHNWWEFRLDPYKSSECGVEWNECSKRHPVSDKFQTKRRDMHCMILTICKHRTRMITPYKFWQIRIDKTPWLTMNGDKSVTNDGLLMALTCFNHYLEMAWIHNPKMPKPMTFQCKTLPTLWFRLWPIVSHSHISLTHP